MNSILFIKLSIQKSWYDISNALIDFFLMRFKLDFQIKYKKLKTHNKMYDVLF